MDMDIIYIAKKKEHSVEREKIKWEIKQKILL
ncbi:hypothetical protein C5S31_05490 [ANME-1 cluster archaeon GoMg2]|nr:hypothetical protein [ANME-1 cluster archaeon GoMg2]